ncbi:cation/H(+) antiporter 15-like protein [Corchorus olitorius]|uniref:Cation/H(+) antiporter 15-like protein n=1 Tax=Corchorus olitorius TaxID=93759 RepID=A0A1R3FVQ4_9ROSI|nr:cation/H(+) antiporter 15-like protein [Corchorus olitorius]
MRNIFILMSKRIDFFVSGLMMPIFFTICGVKVNIFKVEEWKLVVVIVLVLCSMKALLDRDYAVMIITLLLMTSLVAPIVNAIYKQANLPTEYKSRTIQDVKKEAELRMFTCIYSFHNIPGILNLIDLSYATRHNKITVFTLHLVELIGAASATLIVHDSHSHRFDDSHYPPGYSDTLETDQIVNAFREYQSKNRHISIQSLTSVSPFAAMPGDMCRLAEEKQVAFLILPFPKQATTREGLLNESVVAFRKVNKSVLLDAPCSVGIYIEHGLVANTKSFGNHQVAMVFLGGHDDWEALAFAWRMSSHPKVSLTVIRLSEVDSGDLASRKSSMEPVRSYLDRQREMDDDYIAEFRIRTVGKEHVEFKDKPLYNEEELVSTLKDIETRFELFILGRREGLESPLTTGLSSKMDCPELGVIGDWLAKSDSAMGSVLVVQQFIHPENRLDIEQLTMPQLPNPNTVVCGPTTSQSLADFG